MKKFILLFALLPIFAFQLLFGPPTRIKKLEKEFAYIPSGLVVVGKDTNSVQAFYISKLEVTNKQFLEFLADLKAKNKLEEYSKALPDTNCWRMNNFFNTTFTDYYFRHPAYKEYPVVGVSFEGAELYCKWFTEKTNLALKGKHTLNFRLPLREEFLRACRGENHSQKYAWKEEGVWNKDSSILCNHVHYAETKVAGSLDDKNADVLAPSKSYWPNQFGIYNLNGNVAEMTNKKGAATGGSWRHWANEVTNESTSKFDGPLPNVGFRMVTTILNKE